MDSFNLEKVIRFVGTTESYPYSLFSKVKDNGVSSNYTCHSGNGLETCGWIP